jgi:hypothetical protein
MLTVFVGLCPISNTMHPPRPQAKGWKGTPVHPFKTPSLKFSLETTVAPELLSEQTVLADGNSEIDGTIDNDGERDGKFDIVGTVEGERDGKLVYDG